MENKEVAKQIIDLHKSSFDNSFNILISLQDMMLNNFMEQALWLPPEGKKAFTNMMSIYKKGREDFKKLMDDGYKKVEEYISK